MCKVIAYVGAGGKTSSILEEAVRLHQEKKKVVVTTTTHMKQPEIVPEGTNRLTEKIEEAKQLLQAGEVVWYGHPAAEGKFSGPLPEEWQELCQLADVILTEADGSKRLPVKIPAAHEPVIPACADQIIIVMGMSGLGRPIKEVCHRLPLILELLNKEENDILTEADYQKILLEGYIEPLRRDFPDCNLEVYLNQVKGTSCRNQGSTEKQCKMDQYGAYETALLEAAERIGEYLIQTTGFVPVRYVNYSKACRFIK